jgi:hypothetical protein
MILSAGCCIRFTPELSGTTSSSGYPAVARAACCGSYQLEELQVIGIPGRRRAELGQLCIGLVRPVNEHCPSRTAITADVPHHPPWRQAACMQAACMQA